MHKLQQATANRASDPFIQRQSVKFRISEHVEDQISEGILLFMYKTNIHEELDLRL